MAIGGPCVIFAPVVFVLMALALPLWPVALALMGLVWCVTWLLERTFRALGMRAMNGWSSHVAYWLLILFKPKYFFDPVNVRAERRKRFGIADREDGGAKR